ncbi:MAG: AzlD domain-containing protein [bacterium]|nr:AzlD domain-containing protein [bacterium]
MTDQTLIILVAAGALGTFLLRASFLALVPGEKLPAWARRGLRYVPPAVLAALAAPAFVPAVWPVADPANLARPVAAVVASLVAWRARNVLVTIGAGMATLWFFNLLP